MLYKALQRGEAVGLLPDQAPGVGKGVADFSAAGVTMTLVARLQKTSGAAVIMAFADACRAGAAIICIAGGTDR